MTAGNHFNRSLAAKPSARVLQGGEVLRPEEGGRKPRRVQCDETGCRRPAAATIGERNYCQEHAALRQEEAAEEAPTEELPALPEALTRPECQACSSRRFVLAGKDGIVVAVRCTACSKAICARCDGTGYYLGETSPGYEGQVACGCEGSLVRRRAKALTAARIPERFQPWLLGKLPPPKTPLTDSQRAAHLAAWTFAKDYKTSGRGEGLLLYGPPGTGKTLALCRALAKVALEHQVSCRYLDLRQYLLDKKDGFAEGADPAEPLKEFRTPQLLVLDEFVEKKKRAPSDWERQILTYLIHARYDAGKPTLFATNCTPAEIEDRLDLSAWSRLRGYGPMLEVKGPDHRQKGRSR